MKFKGSKRLTLLPMLLLVAAGLQAAPVSGFVNFAGNLSISSSGIQFNPSFISTDGAAETGSFSELIGGTITGVRSLDTGNADIPRFISFTNGMTESVRFDITYIAPGVGLAGACDDSAIGSVCTPNGSPFSFLQLTSGTVVGTLQVNGIAYSGSNNDGFQSATGLFSATMVGTLPEVMTRISNGGLSGIPYSASFVASPVPEPRAMFLIGIGLVCAGLVARRRLSAE